MSRTSQLTGVLAAFCLALAGCSSDERPADLDFTQVVATAVAGMCDSQIVMLGEAADHGRGTTMALKAEITQGLIEQCGFDVVLFESGFYDFAQVHRLAARGEAITEAQISSSIGGVWNRYEEVAPLIPSLTAGVNAGTLTVGGIDANLGSAGAFYSIAAMPDELVGFLPEAEAPNCREAMRRLIYLSYGRSGPSDADRAELQVCIDGVSQGLAQGDLTPADQAALRQMLANMRLYAGFLGQPIEQRLQLREDAFGENFSWWEERLPPVSRFIVWGASVHMAKTARPHPRFADIEIFGTGIHERYGSDAHFLNFIAVSGRYAPMGGDERVIEPPADGSLEALYLDTNGYRYLNRQAVRDHAEIAASLYSASATTDELSAITDSLIVIAEETPPTHIGR